MRLILVGIGFIAYHQVKDEGNAPFLIQAQEHSMRILVARTQPC